MTRISVESLRKPLSILALIVAAVGLVVYAFLATGSSAEASIERLRECLVDPSLVLACGTAEVQALSEGRTPQEVMALLSKNLPQGECHTIGHLVGQEAFRRAGELEGAIELCSYACTGACVHGAIGQAIVTELGGVDADIDPEHLSEEDVAEIAERLCVRRGMCHGVGHILFQIFNEFEEPLRICDSSSRGGAREHCYRGIFMEHADTVSTHNLLLGTDRIRLSDADDLLYPCTTVAPQYQHACFRYLPRVQHDSLVDDTAIAQRARIEACERTEGGARSACFEGYGFFHYSMVRRDPEGAARVCNELGWATDRAACLLGLIYPIADGGNTMIALNFCERVTSPYEQGVCYHGAIEAERYRENVPASVAALSHVCALARDAVRCEEAVLSYVSDPWDTVYGISAVRSPEIDKTIK